MKVISKSVKETSKFATELAKKLESTKPRRRALVIALEGELGAGKTVFVQAFAKALGIRAHITSPTFVLLKQYKPKGKNKKPGINLVHIDAYRMKNHKDLRALGIKEIFADPSNIVLIEWSDRVQKILPKKHFRIHIDHIDQITRKIQIG